MEPAAKLTANIWAEPCSGAHNPCGNFGTDVKSPQGQVSWPPPRIAAGCLIHAVILNGGPYPVPVWNATLEIPTHCHCPAQVNMSYLFRGKDEQAGSGPPILLNLTTRSSDKMVGSFTEYSIAAYGSAIVQINCSAGGERSGSGSGGSVAGQLVVNPSFELDLGHRPELVGSLCSDAPTQWSSADGQGDGTQEGPANPTMPSWTLHIDVRAQAIYNCLWFLGIL